MKVWIEVDFFDGVYIHLREPHPGRHGGWESGSERQHLWGKKARRAFKSIKPGTVAEFEFELSCIWERCND